MKVEKSLNIFISYGHLYNESSRKVPIVVDAIIERIKERKHQIWLDVDRLPDAAITNWPDSDWRSAIYNAINNSDDVVGFLSERSLRQSGVCLDELSIAVSKPGRRIVTVLLESQKTMKIPPTISRIQWVDMSDWESHYDKVNNCFADDGYFDEKFNEIIERIEREENYIYQYDINFLLQTLCPSNTVNTDLFELLKNESDDNGKLIYESRTWLEDILNDYIESGKRYLLLTGGPGYGKSQFLAHCIHNIEDIYAYYFLKYNKSAQEKGCNLLLRTLAFELAAKMPEYRSSLIDSIKNYPVFVESRLSDVLNYYLNMSDQELFDHLFHSDSVHFIDGDPGKIVICIDALDESEKNGNNPVIDLLIHTKGSWPGFFKFILTSRETGNILPRFDYFENEVSIVRLAVPESDSDVNHYLRKRLNYEDIDDYEFDVLTKSCEKTFIYARLLVQSIEDGYTELKTIDDINVLPKGYKGLLQHYFSRAFAFDQFRTVKLPLGIMVANGGSIDGSILTKMMKSRVSGWSLPGFILQMKSFVILQGEAVCFYHKALNDWLNDIEAGDYFIDAETYKTEILDFCKQTINEFNDLAEEEYADATGMDLFEDAMENGFDYKLIKFVYQSCLRLMRKAERVKFKKNEIAFMTTVLWEAYRSSDLYFADEVFAVIKQNAKQMSSYTIKNRFYIAAAYNIIGEVEQMRGNRIPHDSLVSEQTVTADNCQSAIEYFWFIKKSFIELPEYGKLYASIVDNIAFCTRLIDHKSSEKLALAISILEDLKKYEEKKQYDGVEISLAHLFYHEGIIYFDMKNFPKALKCLDESEKYIQQYDEEDRSLGEGLFALVLNQRAGCFNKMGEEARESDIKKAEEYYKRSLADIKESLKLKVKIYGVNSSYVAVAFHSFARYQKDYEVIQPDFVRLSNEVYEYIDEAIKIKKLLFSENGKDTAYSYMQKAWCYDADCRYDQTMIEYIQKAIAISPDTYKGDAKKLFGRAIIYHRDHSNDSMAGLFNQELKNLERII